jgi:methylmalonyl-CoA/ethylmalonyl-CoA epimerase
LLSPFPISRRRSAASWRISVSATTGSEDVEAAKTSTAFFPLPPTNIELVHPLRGEGPIAKYLDKRGGGMHHLCFRSDDIHADVARLKEKGYQFLADAPAPRVPTDA